MGHQRPSRQAQPEPRLDHLLDRAVDPDAVALVERDPHSDPPAVTRLTYAELRHEVDTLHRQLADRGLRRGDVVALWLPNWTDLVVWQFALAALGAAALGVNTRYHVHEVAHLLRRARPACVAVPHAFLGLDFAGQLRRAVADVADDRQPPPTPQVAVLRPAFDGADLAAFDVGGGVWSPASPGPEPPAASAGSADPDDLACVFTTSGSTSAPKLAAHDQHSVAHHSQRVAERFDVRPGDAVLCVLPLSGVFGFTPAFAALAAGAACVLVPVFRPADAVRAMHDHDVTHLVGGDDLFGRLKDAWEHDSVPLSSWRRGGIADFVGRTHEILSWAEQHAGARVCGVYGSSELFALTAIWEPDTPIPQRALGGGRLVSPEIEVRVVAEDTGRELPAGETGELQFRGYNVVREYVGDAAATAAAVTDDGWFRSADLGRLRDDGEGLVYVCRAGDALRLRGFLVNPAEIEEFLASHDDVAVAQVVGVTGSDGADLAVAFVTLRSDAACGEEELMAWCRAHLAAFKVPARVVVIDEFPTTAGTNGTKIQKAVLRRWADELPTAR